MDQNKHMRTILFLCCTGIIYYVFKCDGRTNVVLFDEYMNLLVGDILLVNCTKQLYKLKYGGIWIETCSIAGPIGETGSIGPKGTSITTIPALYEGICADCLEMAVEGTFFGEFLLSKCSCLIYEWTSPTGIWTVTDISRPFYYLCANLLGSGSIFYVYLNGSCIVRRIYYSCWR